jgi:hypothetical protein
MGYTTYFDGEFEVTPPLNAAQINYLRAFSETRRMKRNEAATALRSDPLRDAVGLTVGVDGGYFVGAGGFRGQEGGVFDNGVRPDDIIDYNCPPKGQPGLWCQWIPSEDGTRIEWDDGEKFYDYVEWIEYLVEHFLEPWGCKINGFVRWSGEDGDDRGVIYAKDNMVEAVCDDITNRGPSWE